MASYLADEDAAVRAAKTVESVIGQAWATDPGGRFIYVTPGVPERLGMTLNDFISSGVGGFPWERLVHEDDHDVAAEAWSRSLTTGDHYSLWHRMLRSPHIYGWVWCSGHPLRDPQGQVAGWYGTVIDGGIPSSSFQRREADDIVAQESVDRSEGLPPSRLIHPEDRSVVNQAEARAFFFGVPQITTYRQLQPDGSYNWVEFRAEPQQPPSVDIDPHIAKHDDRWTVLEEVGETEEAVKAAQVIENLYGGAWAMDARGHFTYATPIAQTSISMTLEDLNAPISAADFIDGGDRGWQLGVHPEDVERVATSLRRALRTGCDWNNEYRILRASGQYVWHRVAGRPTRDAEGGITGWYGTSHDIDVFKKTEAVLREREYELSQLVNMVPSHVWRLTPAGKPTFFNQRMVDYIGFNISDGPNGEKTGVEIIIEIVHPDDAQQFRMTINRCLATGERFVMRYRLRRHDGSYRWMSSRAEPMRGADGRIIHWYGVCHDTHDLMTAQEALQKSERHLWQLVETLPAMIYCATPAGDPTYRSEKLRNFLGFSLEDKDRPGTTRLLSTLDAIIHPDDRAAVREDYGHSLATGAPYARKHRLRRSDGAYRWVETRASAMRNDEGEIIQWNGICLDIDDQVNAQNELRLMQERLARAAQAASLAELSASIAHEVNQPLAAVVANSHACQRWLGADPPNLARAELTLDRILRDANAAANVVSRIRALFRQSKERRTSTPIEDMIRDVQRLMADVAAAHGAVVQTVVESNIPSLRLDRVQVQQVLINLIRNGMEAMDEIPGERTLTISAGFVCPDVQVRISDTGPGIEHPERVFEPFFTTKESGMGMGLAICRSIVEAHGGRLWAEKNEMNGATFTFTVPVEVTVA